MIEELFSLSPPSPNTVRLKGKGQRGKGKGKRAKGKGQRAKGKGKRAKGKAKRGKVSNTSFTLYPLTFSQTTREVHTAYPNRIAPSSTLRVRASVSQREAKATSLLPNAPCPMPHAQCPMPHTINGHNPTILGILKPVV
ncbi:hypothetical protein [Nostoc linckia]|uniref:hypothetical protein n=1 Tax=Nostoc linckia TaxID=92942 RepID=UPI0015D4DD5D|nr:hypothetical protein [Nostoc linckia]